MRLKDVILAVASGILLVLIFPPFNLEVVAWVYLIPLLYAIKEKTSLESLFLGLIQGLVFFLGLLYWIFFAANTYGKLHPLLSILVLLLLVSYLSLYQGIFTFFITSAEKKAGFKPIVTAPFLGVSLEYLRSFLLSGFPWESLGYSQFLTLPIIQIADITGVYGISFLIILVNSALFGLTLSWNAKKMRVSGKEAALTAIILLGTVIYGYWRLEYIEALYPDSQKINIGIAQGNIEQDKKWVPDFQEETLKVYWDLTETLADSNPDLIVWPETALPFYFQSSQYRSLVLALAQKIKAPILCGSLSYKEKEETSCYFNSAFLVFPEKKISQRCDKIHLVPFGEYVPLKRIFPFVHKMVEGVGDFSPGTKISNFSFPPGNFGVLICYEIIFPDLARRFIKQGGNFLVNITNDAWFGKTSAPCQHFSMASLRAVENRVFVVRAANTGISGIIDATGRIKSETEVFTRGVLAGEIHIMKTKTFYCCYGDIFSYLCLGFVIFIIVRTLIGREKIIAVSCQKTSSI